MLPPQRLMTLDTCAVRYKPPVCSVLPGFRLGDGDARRLDMGHVPAELRGRPPVPLTELRAEGGLPWAIALEPRRSQNWWLAFQALSASMMSAARLSGLPAGVVAQWKPPSALDTAAAGD